MNTTIHCGMMAMSDKVKPEAYFYTITLCPQYGGEGETRELEEFYLPKGKGDIILRIASVLSKRGWFPAPVSDPEYAVSWVRDYTESAGININYTGAGPWDVSAMNWMELHLIMCMWNDRGIFDHRFWDVVHAHCTYWELKQKEEME